MQYVLLLLWLAVIMTSGALFYALVIAVIGDIANGRLCAWAQEEKQKP